jgi:putative SOS response-associated peptidase YedK
MCYDISLYKKTQAIAEALPELDPQQTLTFSFDPSYHKLAMSYPRWPIVIRDASNRLQLTPMEWGIIAPYMRTEADLKKWRPLLCNTTCEKIRSPRSFWYQIRSQRCLIPVNGFFEPHKVKGQKHSEWYYIHRPDRSVFFIPGLYHYPTHLPDKETGELIGTFSLITRPANSTLSKIHNNVRIEGHYRMPMMLTEELEKVWLQTELTETDWSTIYDYMLPDKELTYWQVAPPRKFEDDQDPLLLKPISNEKLL